jgi:CheY-like chemotaxis protein
MDLEMPEMDGHEAAQAIRRDARFNRVPIIAMTAHALNEIEDRCLQDGMQAVLTKPVNPAQLYKMLAHWLDQRLHTEPKEGAVSSNDIIISGDGDGDGDGGGDGGSIGDDGLPNLPGIDNAVGLSHVEGNHALYLQLLKRFRWSQQNVMKVLRGHCHNEYRQAAIRDVHTIRGVAANIGAYELTDAAKVVERLLSDLRITLPNVQLERHLNALEATFTTLLAGLDAYFASHEESPENWASGVPFHDLQKEIQHLSDLLATCNAEANDYFQAIRGHLMTAVNASELAHLTQAIHDYEYEDAFLRLQRINARADVG